MQVAKTPTYPVMCQFPLFGQPYYRSSLWYSVSSVVCLSVTFCIVAKRCVLAKKCLKEWIRNQGQKVHFLGRRHISTSGFGATATEAAFFALFFAHTAQQSVVDGPNGLSSSKPCAYWVAAIFLLPVSPLRPPQWPLLPYFCSYSPAIVTRWYKLTF